MEEYNHVLYIVRKSQNWAAWFAPPSFCPLMKYFLSLCPVHLEVPLIPSQWLHLKPCRCEINHFILVTHRRMTEVTAAFWGENDELMMEFQFFLCVCVWSDSWLTEVVFLSFALFGAVPATLSSAREVAGGISRAVCAVEYKTLWSFCLALSQAGIDLFLTLKC